MSTHIAGRARGRAARAIAAAALVLTGVVVATPAAANSRGTMVVLGDSVSETAFWVERGGKASTIWWARVPRAAHLTPRVHAVRGSGYAKRGKCQSSTIGERLHERAVAAQIRKAKVVIIAAGVNDNAECYVDENGETLVRPLTLDALDAAVSQAFIDLDALTNRTVYVTVPYGPIAARAKYKTDILKIIKARAAEHKFVYVHTAGTTLASPRNKDGVHPNAAGAAALYNRVYFHTDLHRRFPRRG